MSVNNNTLRILQDGLKNTVSIHRATPAPNSGGYCDRGDGEEAGSTKEEPHSEPDPEEAHQNADSLCVVEDIVRHVASGPPAEVCGVKARPQKGR